MRLNSRSNSELRCKASCPAIEEAACEPAAINPLPHIRFLPHSVVCLPSASAQTTPPITSSGHNTRVSPPSTLHSGKVQHDITGDTRPGGGWNLFHSFGDFNVPNNNIANFLNDSGAFTTNILGRVTGGNISNIFGMIQITGFA